MNKNSRIKQFFDPETKKGQIAGAAVFPVAIIVLYFIFDIILGGGVLVDGNAFLTLISHTVIHSYIAWGLIFIFSGGPDFSIAGAMIIGANVAAAMVTMLGWGYFGLFFGCIAVTVLLQLLATFVRIKFKLATWISGLAMLLIYEAIASVYTSSRAAMGQTNITLGADQCRDLGRGIWPSLFLVVGIIVMYIIYSRTSIGVNYRAVSCNKKVAGYMGINSNKTEYIAAIVGAILAGLAVAMTLSSNARVDTYTGMGSFSLIGKALAAWLLSGAMEKRLSKPIAIMLGAFFTALIFNVMTRLGVPSGTWQDVANCICILVFGALSFVGTKEVIK